MAQCNQPLDIVWKAIESECMCTLRAPSGRLYCVPCFAIEKDSMCVRICADEVGEWEYALENNCEGRFFCKQDEKLLGLLRVTEDQRGFYDSARPNEPLFIMGYECDWLFALSQTEEGLQKLDAFLQTLSEYGFNQLYVNLYAHDTEWCPGNTVDEDYGPPALYPFGGTNDMPDFTTINDEFFRCFDLMMDMALAHRMYIELYFKVFNKLVSWPEKDSPEERKFFRYVVARYQGYPNIIWNFAKEAYYETDKDLIYRFYRNIDEWDQLHHLKTIHDDKIFCGIPVYRAEIDVLTTQQHFDGYTTALSQQQRYNMPVVAAEFGYECGLKGTEDLSYMYGQTPEEYVRRAYEMIMARACPVYYYTYTAWDIIITEHCPPGYTYWKNMKAYFERIGWYRFMPNPDVCCWRGRCLCAGKYEYIFMIDPDEHALFRVNDAYLSIKVEWYNMYTGATNQETFGREEIETRGAPSLIVLNNPYQGMWAIAHVVLTEAPVI